LKSDQNIPQLRPASTTLEGKLRGLLLPLPTPFSADQALAADGLQQNIEKWNATSINGYVMLGSTGERVHLDEREYVQVSECARERVAGEKAFLLGVGQQSTRGTIAEVEVAAAAGADAVLVITPYFYRAAITQDALLTHYTAVADSSPVPVILYSMPALTGIKIEPETVARLSEHQNIIGIKDSSADIAGLRRTVELVSQSSAGSSAATRKDFLVLTGNGTVLYDALRAGAAGAILAVGCVVPDLCLEIFRAVKADEYERASALQEKLTPLAQAVTTRFGIGGLKAALDMIGFAGGAVRAPLRSPDEAALQEIAQLLAAAQSAITDQTTEAATG
jgi:4-hydroxy-2-oxoglutarate aldolase